MVSKSVIVAYVIGLIMIIIGLVLQFQWDIMAAAIGLYVCGSVLISVMAVLQLKEYNSRTGQKIE